VSSDARDQVSHPYRTRNNNNCLLRNHFLTCIRYTSTSLHVSALVSRNMPYWYSPDDGSREPKHVVKYLCNEYTSGSGCEGGNCCCFYLGYTRNRMHSPTVKFTEVVKSMVFCILICTLLGGRREDHSYIYVVLILFLCVASCCVCITNIYIYDTSVYLLFATLCREGVRSVKIKHSVANSRYRLVSYIYVYIFVICSACSLCHCKVMGPVGGSCGLQTSAVIAGVCECFSAG
jgi:hypothetical protein